MNFAETIIILSHLPILLAALSAGWLYKRLDKQRKVFTAFIFLSAVVQFISLAMWFGHNNNLPLLHFYVAAGFVCLCWFYATLLQGFVDGKIIWSVAGIFLVFTTVNSLFFQPFLTFNSNALTVESVLVVILALFTFVFFLNDIVKETAGRNIKSLHWINSGLFIYYSSSLLIFYFGSAITETSAFTKTIGQYAWILHSFFSMVMYTCILIGLWRQSKI